jgi:hypothetical protein
MGDDRGRWPGPGRPARGRTTGSSVLTPPTGLPSLPVDARPVADPAPQTAAVPPVLDVPAPPLPVVAPCVCGHGRDAHEHWRRGSDCGACGSGVCAAYRRRGGLVRRLLRSAGLVE